MFNHNPLIDTAPSHEALKQARNGAFVGVALTAATVPLLPAAPLVHIALLPLGGLAAYLLSKRYSRLQDDFKSLGQRRGFRFDANEVPRKRDATGKVIPPVLHWRAEMPPYRNVLVDDTLDCKRTKVWRKRLEASDQWQEIIDRQSDWLVEHAPARFEVVEEWWHQWYLQPLLRRRHGRVEACTEDQVKSAAEAMYVDLLIGIAIAGQEHLWTRKLGSNWDKVCCEKLSKELAALPEKGLANPQPPDFPVQMNPRYDDIFLGRGFQFEQQHTQALEELKLRNLSDLVKEPEEQGDPRIYGVGHRQVHDIFTNEDQLKQMCGIFGANGVGKTRFAQVLIDQAIDNGYPVIVIDPKSDEELLNHIVEKCRKRGRSHQFRFMSLAAPTRPETWDFLCRYNPCYDYNDPAELSSRVAALVPNTKDPFWANRAKGLTETCMTLCHWVNWFLRLLDRDHVTGQHAPKDSQQVPRILLAMQWARNNTEATPEEADEAISEILTKMQQPGWTPTRDDEREVVDLALTKSLARIPIYCPNEWVPTVRHVSEYMIDGTLPFLGWILKIVYPHLYLGTGKTANPQFPRLAGNTEIINSKGAGGQGEEASMYSAYLNALTHPLELRYEANSSVPPNLNRWVSFYDYFIPEFPKDDYHLGRFFENLRKRLAEHATECGQDRQKFSEQASTLNSSIKPFLGDLGRIMCSVESDVVWQNVVDENQVVYCGLASMLNRIAAQSAAKLLAEDFMSYVGRRYQYYNEKPPVYLFADEISSFISDGFIDLLNKARGAGMRGIIIGQTGPDLKKMLGAEGADMAMGNLNTFIQLRTLLSSDAESFSKRANKVSIIKRGQSSNITPAAAGTGNELIQGLSETHGASISTQSTALIESSNIMQLPRGQAFIHMKGVVYLVAQGLFSDPSTNYPVEVGYKEGVMADLAPDGLIPKRPSPKPRRTGRGSQPSDASRPITTGHGTAAKAPEKAVSTPLTATPALAGRTFRHQTDANALADDPEAQPVSDPYPRSGSSSRKGEHESSVDRTVYDDPVPPSDDISVL